LTKWRFLTKIGQHIFGKYIKKKKWKLSDKN
jgi:hypothetical protein